MPAARRSEPPRLPRCVALTGGIACGKSAVGRCLRDLGAAVLDTDAVAHALLRRGTPVYRRVVRRFGRSVQNPDGSINRRALGRRVFADAAARRALNGWMHPAVLRRVAKWRAAQRRRGRDAVVLVPLLFEAGAGRGWDTVICVAAPRAAVQERLRARGLTRREAEQRIRAQWPLREKMKRSDVVLCNDRSLAALRQRTRRIWQQLSNSK